MSLAGKQFVEEVKSYCATVLNEQRKDIKDLIFYTDPIRSTASLTKMDLTEFVAVQQEGLTINWSFNIAPELESIEISSAGSGGSRNRRNLFHTKHDLIGDELFSKQTDIELKKVFGSYADGCDRLTPDFIEIFPNFILVLEIGTCSSSAWVPMQKMYDKKLLKYAEALRIRAKASNKTIFFFPLIVNYDSLLFPFKLSSEVVNKIVYLFRLGKAIEMKCTDELGIEDKLTNPTEDALVKEFKKCLDSQEEIPNEDKSGYDFTSSTYQYYRNYKINPERIKESIKRISKATEKYNVTKSDAIRLLNKTIEEHYKEITDNERCKIKDKSVVQFPLFIPTMSDGANPSLETPGVTDTDITISPILRLWQCALNGAQLSGEKFVENVDRIMEVSYLDSDEEIEKLFKDKSAPLRRSWHRIKIKNLNNDLRACLSKDGIWGKRFKNSIERIEKREKSKTTFHPKSPTIDIEEFLKAEIKYYPIFRKLPVLKMLKSLVWNANDLVNNEEKGQKIVHTLMETDIFTSLIVLQAIATELCISLKQNVNDDEFVYKKIRGTDVELLIHPTKSSSHVFFSIRFKKDTIIDNSVFRTCFEHNGWWYTDLLSSNKSKLSNLIKAPYTWINSQIHWFMRYDTKFDHENIDKTILGRSAVNYLAKLSLLFSLEDKFATEEMATGLRYICMQLLKGDSKSSHPQPHLALKKLPTILRSRLGVFIYNKLIKYTKLQMSKLPVYHFGELKKADNDELVDAWSNLIHPYTEEEIPNCRVLVETFYIAYTKNKDENSQNNVDYQMIKKILAFVHNESEEKVKNGTYSGKKPMEGDELPTNHEFCIDNVVYGCNLACQEFRCKYGTNYEKTMETYIILEALRRTSFESLATLKASALFENIPDKFNFEVLNKMRADDDEELTEIEVTTKGPDDRERKKKMKQQKKILKMPMVAVSYNMEELSNGKTSKVPRKQCKCIESVAREIRSGMYDTLSPIFKLDMIINIIKESFGGICCYLFKKNQHGGLREIYVLEFKSRIVQCFVETLGRALCREFSEETMTHPESKTQLMQEHNNRVSEAAFKVAGNVLSRGSSEDKSKWNQNCNVNLFALILSRLLSPSLGKMAFKILSLWRTKKILIPEGVLHMIIKGFSIPGEPYLEGLKSEFWSGGGKLIKEKGNIFMVTTTGMFQGILHYVSSLQHVIQSIHYKHMLTLLYYPILYGMNVSYVEVMTLVSSDDSMTKVSAVIPAGSPKEICEKIDSVMCSMLHLEDAHSSLFNMIESAKTCMASSTVIEFNSTFFLSGHSINPIIKSVYACLSIVESESLVTRQESYYNLMKDIYENGAGHFQSHLHQMVQALFHYSSMGLFPCLLYPEWVALLMSCPDPSLGYFLLDTDILCGLMGYNYTLYTALTSTNVPVILSHPKMLKTGEKYQLRNSIIMLHNNRQRWIAIANAICTNDWREKINKNPEILYEASPSCLNNLELKLSCKVSSKGVFESLSGTNSLVTIFSSSVYGLTHPSFTIKEYNLTQGEENKYKRSLIALTKHAGKLCSDKSLDILKYSDLPTNVKAVIFPNYDLFDTVRKRVEYVRKNSLYTKVKQFRQCRNTIIIRNLNVDHPIPLISVLRSIWYQFWVPYGKSLISASYVKYKDTYPWLSDDPDETLESSPFENHVELYNFISGLSQSRSKSHPICRKITATTSIGQIMESMKFNQMPGVLYQIQRTSMTEKFIEEERFDYNLIASLRHLISYVLIAPVSLVEKEEFLSDVIKSVPSSIDKSIFSKIPENLLPTVAFIAMIQGGELGDVVKILVERKIGLIPIFLIEQKRGYVQNSEKVEFHGYGKLLMIQKDNSMIIHLYDKQVTRIETNEQKTFKGAWSVVKHMLLEMGICFKNTLTHSKYANWKREYSVRAQYLNMQVDSNGAIENALRVNDNLPQVYGFDSSTISLYQSIKFEEYILEYTILEASLLIYIRNRRSKVRIKLFNIYPCRRLGFNNNIKEYWPKPIRNSESLLSCWVYFDSLSPHSLSDIIKDLYINRKSLTNHQQSLKNWLSIGLVHKLISRSKLRSKTIDAAELYEGSSQMQKTQADQMIVELFQSKVFDILGDMIGAGKNLDTEAEAIDPMLIELDSSDSDGECASTNEGDSEPTSKVTLSEGSKILNQITNVNIATSSTKSDEFNWSEDVEDSDSTVIEEKDTLSNEKKKKINLDKDRSPLSDPRCFFPALGDLGVIKDLMAMELKKYENIRSRRETMQYNVIDGSEPGSILTEDSNIMDRLSDISTFSECPIFTNSALSDYFTNHPLFDNYIALTSMQGIWDILNGERPCHSLYKKDCIVNSWLCNIPFPEGFEEPIPLYSDIDCDWPALPNKPKK